MNAENQRLRGMLTQVTNNYTALQMHLATLMQQQRQNISITQNTHDHNFQIVEAKLNQEKIVPRRFLELGRSGNDLSHNSNSSSEERTVSKSPRNDTQVTIMHNKGREESPESDSWVPNKVPKLNSSMPIDPTTDATMRKARVSVRARSEAPMVHIHHLLIAL